MEKTEIKKKIRTLDIILAFMFACIVVFTVTMIIVFMRMGSVPDTLIVAVFAFFGLEAGMCGWIKTTKDRLNKKLEDLKDEGRDIITDDLCHNDGTGNGSFEENAGEPEIFG